MPDLRYRFADPGDLTGERVAGMLPGPDPDGFTIVIEPGHATLDLLDRLGGAPARDACPWARLPDTPENRLHPHRVLHAGWQLTQPEALPEGMICMSVERSQRYDLVIREGHASPQLVAEMTWLLTRTMRNGVWVRSDAEEHGDN